MSNTQEFLCKQESLDPDSTEYMISVMRAYLDGKTIQIADRDYDWGWKDWDYSCHPNWDWASHTYRIKQEEKIPPSIPWNAIEDHYDWFTVDEDGEGWLWSGDEPDKSFSIGKWLMGREDGDQGESCELQGVKWERGNLPWDQTLIKRPA